MKWNEIPAEVLDKTPIYPPVKLVVDNDALFNLLKQQQWLIIQTNPQEDNPSGNAMIKAFNCHVRYEKGMRLLTKRLSTDKWIVTLKTNNVRGTK